MVFIFPLTFLFVKNLEDYFLNFCHQFTYYKLLEDYKIVSLLLKSQYFSINSWRQELFIVKCENNEKYFLMLQFNKLTQQNSNLERHYFWSI